MRRCLTSSARYRYMMKSLTDTWHRARTIALVELKSSMPRVSSFRLDNPIDLEIFISLFYRYESWEFHVDCRGISNLRIYIGKSRAKAALVISVTKTWVLFTEAALCERGNSFKSTSTFILWSKFFSRCEIFWKLSLFPNCHSAKK